MKKAIWLGILFIFILTASGFAASLVKSSIAVVANGNTVDSAVSSVAARGPYFLIFDGNGKFIKCLSNSHKNAGGGASALVVDYLSAEGITTIIAGDFGDKMIVAMKAKRIQHLEFKGTAADAVKKAVQ